MALGDIIVFNQFGLDVGDGEHDLNADTLKLALVDDTLTPTATTTIPHFGGTGTTDLSANEVTPGGNYSAGGVTLANVAYTLSGAVSTLAADKVLIAQDGSNPTNARWAVLYNDTATNKHAICAFDLASDRDLSAGPYEQRFNSVDGNGAILTHTVS